MGASAKLDEAAALAALAALGGTGRGAVRLQSTHQLARLAVDELSDLFLEEAEVDDGEAALLPRRVHVQVARVVEAVHRLVDVIVSRLASVGEAREGTGAQGLQ